MFSNKTKKVEDNEAEVKERHAKIGKLVVDNDFFFTMAEAMSPSERKAMINRDRTDPSLTRQCKLLKISRSSLYYAPIGMNAETLELMNEIDRVFTKYPFFESHQIVAYLPRNGFQAKRGIDEWLEFYNAERPHTALDKRTPDDAYFETTQMNRAA
ncbi:integrase core domain-containing protein [Salipiger sp. 1_MG-2023]|uniref:integrase core domain-containing protein n=1 Tax=Salipiger sp. 1_MG-2023 TaxID=3062665 RepID=UPI0026E3838A|nr:integrase core domain-containing protein [Salipiger sp. 1_MG-2023]MDO6588314.1 integrase core domain-containing protein [Salipiger sp. 1_MG-2023]